MYNFRCVAGQRAERHKWAKVFDQATAIIWVVSLAEFDQVLYEDHSMNRMMESLDLIAKGVSGLGSM